MFHFLRAETLYSVFSEYKYITVIGAGGKTSLIECIAENFQKRGFSPVITTTTKIHAKRPFVLDEDLNKSLLKGKPFLRVGKELIDGKLHGVSEKTLITLGEFYDVILIEGDGAKGKPLKYPADYEPVIPALTDIVILVCGLDALNKRVDEVVFRWELFCEREGVQSQDIIKEDMFVTLASGPMLKGVNQKKYVVCLNKYDALNDKKNLLPLLKRLAERTDPEFFLVSSVIYGIFYTCKRW